MPSSSKRTLIVETGLIFTIPFVLYGAFFGAAYFHPTLKPFQLRPDIWWMDWAVVIVLPAAVLVVIAMRFWRSESLLASGRVWRYGAWTIYFPVGLEALDRLQGGVMFAGSCVDPLFRDYAALSFDAVLKGTFIDLLDAFQI